MHTFTTFGYLVIVGVALVIVETAHWQAMRTMYKASDRRATEGEAPLGKSGRNLWSRWGEAVARHAAFHHGSRETTGLIDVASSEASARSIEQWKAEAAAQQAEQAARLETMMARVDEVLRAMQASTGGEARPIRG